MMRAGTVQGGVLRDPTPLEQRLALETIIVLHENMGVPFDVIVAEFCPLNPEADRWFEADIHKRHQEAVAAHIVKAEVRRLLTN